VKDKKKLLLHSCCAPCSSYVLEFLQNEYDITVFFFNPNITDVNEYELRRNEQKRLIPLLGGVARRLACETFATGVVNPPPTSLISPTFLEAPYTPNTFLEASKDLETEPEGGERCFRCYELRLRETARTASELGFDHFTTTLTVSPHKNAVKINEIGQNVQSISTYLPFDFKKNGGYQRSVELSKQYNLYRQNFCGCTFSVKCGIIAKVLNATE